MSWLERVAGLEGVKGEGRLSILEAQAHAFLVSGGVVTPEVWLDLKTDERAAFLAAGERRDAENALLLTAALRGQTGELARRIGGERARTRQILVAEAVTE